MNTFPLIFYVAAAAFYALHFARRTPALGHAATMFLMAGAMAHTFVIGMQTMEVGHVPFVGRAQAISTFVWLLGLSYLYTEMSSEERAMGGVILPMMVLLQLVPVLSPIREPRIAALESPWFWVHVSSLLFSYASFALAGVIGVTYILQFKEIKKKQLGYLYQRLPSLQVMDVMNGRAVAVGWCFLTLGVAVGAFWAVAVRDIAPQDPRVQAMGALDPKIFVGIVTWLIYSFSVVARRVLGWHGRRAAWLSAAGFVVVMLNFLPISYFVTNSHNFY